MEARVNKVDEIERRLTRLMVEKLCKDIDIDDLMLLNASLDFEPLLTPDQFGVFVRIVKEEKEKVKKQYATGEK